MSEVTINRVTYLGQPLAEQMRAFNAERAAILSGKPISGDERIPGPFTGVGGDVAPPGRER